MKRSINGKYTLQGTHYVGTRGLTKRYSESNKYESAPKRNITSSATVEFT